MSLGFSYDVHEGVILDEPDGQDLWLERYGFVPDRFVPVLGQYQAIRNPNLRSVVGTTAWSHAGLAGLNRMVMWATLGSQQYVTKGAQKAMMAGAAFPTSPFGKVLRGYSYLSLVILAYDYGIGTWQSLLEDAALSLNPLNYNPFMV